MSDLPRRFTFNPPADQNQDSDKDLEEREQSFSHPNPFGDSMEAVKKAKDITDPKSNTSDFERNFSNQFASRGGDTTNPVQEKNGNNSSQSIRRSPIGKLQKESKKDVKQLMGKPPSSGRESLGQASMLPAFQGANISRTSLVSHVKQVNLRSQNNQSQQPIQWAQTAKFNDPNQSMHISDFKDSEEEQIPSLNQKKRQEILRKRYEVQESMKQTIKSDDQNLNSQNANASIKSFNNLVAPLEDQPQGPQIEANQPEQPSDITLQKTNIVEQDRIIHEQDVEQLEKPAEFIDSQNREIELQPKNEKSQLSKSKVSWTKESTIPEEIIVSKQDDFTTPKPEQEGDQITEQNPQNALVSNNKSLTNKSLVLSSNDNADLTKSNQQRLNLNIQSQEYNVQKEETSPYIFNKERHNMKVALETMDPHFEGSQQSRHESASLTPMDESDGGDEPFAIDNDYNTRMPDFSDANMGIILAKSLDEREEQDVPMGQAVKSPEEIEEEKREYEEILKLGDSLWLTDLFVDRPWTVVFFGGCVILGMCALCVGFKLYWPSLVTVRDLLDYSDIHTQLFDARRAAFGEIQRKSSPNERIPLQSIIDNNWQLLIGIECVKEDCDNIMTPEGIKLMHDIDETINNDTIWHKICLQDSVTNKTCMDRPEPGYFSSKASPLTIFKLVFGDDLQEMTQFGIDFALFGLAQELDYFDLALPLFGTEFTRNNRKTKLMRMALTFAGPIEIDDLRFNNIEDRQETQELFIANWQADLNTKIMKLQEEKYPGYVIHTFGRSYYYRQFYRQLIFDVFWSALAVFFCFCYVFFHTKSFFVTASSMAMILYSFPITLVIYKLIMGIQNVSSLHLLIVFVVLGISCDNIFVVFDAWEQSEMYPQFAGSLHKRMAYTFRRASLAILATSSTTAFAFLSNGFSKLMPVSAFGYFAFVIVPVNYVLIVFYFPAYLIVYENHIKSIEQKMFRLLTISCTLKKSNKVGQTESGDQLEAIEILESNSLNLKHDKIQTRFEDDSFITNQIFQTQRGSKGSMKQIEYYEYMQQYYQIKQKEAKLAAIISSHRRNQDVRSSSSPKPRKRKPVKMKRNSQPSLKLSKHKSQTDQVTIKSVESLPSKGSKGSKATLLNSKHSSINNHQMQANKRYNTAASQEVIFEEYYQENEEQKEGGEQQDQEQSKETSKIHQISQKQQLKKKYEQQQLKKKAQKQLRNTFIVDEKQAQKHNIFDLKSEAKLGGSVIDFQDKQQPKLITESQDAEDSEEICQIQMKTQEAEKPSSKSKEKNATTSRSLLAKNNNNVNQIDLNQGMDRGNDTSGTDNKGEAKEYGAVAVFLDTKWNDFVRTFRWIFIIVGFAAAGYAGYRSLEIQGLSQMEAYFPVDHYMQVSLDKQLNSFNQNEVSAQFVRVDVMWGILGINKTNVEFYNASDFGTVDWDTQFDITLGDNQQRVYDFCQYLKTRKDLLYQQKETSLSCWIDDFKNWLDTQRQRFPVQAIVYRNQQENFYYQLHTFINESKAGQDHFKSQNIGFIDDKMVYMRVQMLTSASPFSPYKIKKPIWEEWDRILENFNSNSGKGINKALQTAGIDWCFAIMEIGLVNTMKNGLKLSIGFALIALLIATQNIIQAFIASLTIALIIINVMAIVAYKNWPLGSSESVGVVVCVGFAVDYVVHLASHYVHSKAKDRNGRIRESLKELGGSILSGSITTIGASCCLFLGVLTMFHKFGLFVISTIAFSIFYSLGFFAALCHVVGPVGQFGNIDYMYQTSINNLKSLFKKQEPVPEIEDKDQVSNAQNIQ